jgi:cytochrome c-type biogenesis protein CcmH
VIVMTGLPRLVLTRRSALIGPICAVLLLVSALVPVVLADSLDDGVRRVGKQLQCPICSGATVADSPSDLAGQMRGVIRSKLQAGESDQQIIDYFVERYGDGVLIEPPRRGISLLVWVAPVIMLVAGGFLLWRLLRSWMRPRPVSAAVPLRSPGPAYQNGTAHGSEHEAASTVDRARVELDRYQREA